MFESSKFGRFKSWNVSVEVSGFRFPVGRYQLRVVFASSVLEGLEVGTFESQNV